MSNGPNKDTNDIKNWAGNKCKLFLKEHKALQSGNVQILRERCIFLDKLIRKDLQMVVSLTVKELRHMRAQLSVQDGTKDEMVKRVSLVLLKEDSFDVDCVVTMLNSIKK